MVGHDPLDSTSVFHHHCIAYRWCFSENTTLVPGYQWALFETFSKGGLAITRTQHHSREAQGQAGWILCWINALPRAALPRSLSDLEFSSVYRFCTLTRSCPADLLMVSFLTRDNSSFWIVSPSCVQWDTETILTEFGLEIKAVLDIQSTFRFCSITEKKCSFSFPKFVL